MTKRIHKADKVSGAGAVSALCYKTPRAINLRKASWTLIDGNVTCPRCLAALAAIAKAKGAP